METRRSCRNFKADMVRDEELKAIIKAGTYAAEPAKDPVPRKADYVYHL